MSATPVIAKLYPVVLALANTGLGVGLYATDALLFAALTWTSATLVLVGLCSSVAPVVSARLENIGDMSH